VKDRVTFGVLFVLVVVAVVMLLSMTPASAADGVSAGIFLSRGQTDLGVSWSLALTAAPSVPLWAEGLLAGKSYGVGVVTPITTLTRPLFRALKLKPSPGFATVLDNVQVGTAVLTPDLKRFDVGLYTRVTAFKVAM
jgi:hypothetical protein